MANKEKVVGFYASTARRLLNRLGSGSEGQFTEWHRRGGGVRRMIQGPIATASGAGVTVLVVASSDKRMIGQTVTVVDFSGCIFDEDYVDLIGVWIWADWQYAVAAPDGAWVAVNRCCI